MPGFVEIDLVGHEGPNATGEQCFTLIVSDIATGWTKNRTAAAIQRQIQALTAELSTLTTGNSHT